MHLCTRTHTLTHTSTQMQDSLPGTRQQSTAKWDVWEPPAAKRRTGRRNKPSLMETWHARRGGNSNKRLMGHGAFSTAAKYPLLIPSTPLSVLSCSRSVPCWPRGFDISRLRPLPWGDIFLPTPFPNSAEIPERSGQDNINIATISQEPHAPKAEWFTLLLTVLNHCFKLDTQTDFHSCKHQVDSITELVHIAFSSCNRHKLGHYLKNAVQLSSSAPMNSDTAPNKTTGPEKI